jgi:hypothetical protein
MKRILVAATCCMLIIAITGCQKKDQWPWGLQKRCDYVEASSKAISNENDQVLPLFTKTFDNSGKLTKIRAAFRNIVGAYYVLEDFNVSYQGYSIFFTRPSGDTVAALQFNNNKKLIWAVTNIPFGTNGSQQYNFRFLYQAGKLKSIESQDFLDNEYDPEPNPWFPYLQLSYDNGFKNVSRLDFGSAHIDYEYDHQKKAKEQFYPDEMYGETHKFWYLLKYLNVVPDANPENLLKRSVYSQPEEGYPNNFERRYSDHKLDGSGKLVSYWQKNTWEHQNGSEFWTVKWNCFK